MAHLTYTAQNGQEVSIPLPAKRGFTLKIEWFEPVLDVHHELLKIAKAAHERLKQGEDGDHVVYNKSDWLLVVVIQPKAATSQQAAKDQTGMRSLEIWIHRSRRAWIVVTQKPHWLLIDQQPIPLLKILKDGMALQLGSMDLTFHEIEQTLVTTELLRTSNLNPCAFCKDEFEFGETLIRCPSCGTVHHLECWQAYEERCSGPTGCQYGRKKRHDVVGMGEEMAT